MFDFKPEYVIPALRSEISFKIKEENGEKSILLSDPENIASQPIVLPINLIPLFQLINGDYKYAEVVEIIGKELKEEKDYVLEIFKELVINLDYLGYLESPRFLIIKQNIEEYLASEVRKEVCAGSSYPSERQEFSAYIESILNIMPAPKRDTASKAIIVPHIDFITGSSARRAYSASYREIEKTDADLFVIFGTSHYSDSDFFMPTYKHFSTPAGIVESDRNILNKLRSMLSFNLKFDDLAHREEHSIELQTVLLNRAFTDRDFTILPILTSSFLNLNDSSGPNPNFARIEEFLTTLKRVVDESGRKAVYIASADLSHIGRKFGDDFDAEEHLDRLKNDDALLLSYLMKLDGDGFLKEISECRDKNRICGISPVYSLMKVLKYEDADLLAYGQWNEKETGSAVSFASMAFR